MTEQDAMKRAIELGLRGSGAVSPNPRVGCVILRDGQVIGEGWHEQYGGEHAEANAIANAGGNVEGATVVVTLEPCAHEGKQPPCADLLIRHKVACVVVGTTDPNPLVAGGGIAKLREAGIEVVTGILEEECRWLCRFFIKHITSGEPYIIAKIAQSFDGCISTARGESKWITGDDARRRVHAMRSEVDAVMIGRGTALSDDPELTTRDVDGAHPRRIVLDSHLSLPLSLKLFSDSYRNNTFVLCNKRAAQSRKADSLRVAGVNIAAVDDNSDSSMNINAVVAYCGKEMGITSMMVEGGSQLLSSVVQHNLVDELHIFTAPILIGDGKHSFSSLYSAALKDARRFQTRALGLCGNDIHVIATRV
ncbi:MAG: bifunctional diaminohydroxyphosphoribosylaminopyrimidine deaminase/5-amino-6-(5-phosphoribosylamino)uracil reductase RibD [Candidatus Kapabacteria bacterium]|nr:bifunctional diaminohydroxyphosphoribosylaminopyrimidine deaminase/5-amino-6-(5-phosphoribosylamino)uracil reductase RibD [Candidatus Kapabacteria bacterium]